VNATVIVMSRNHKIFESDLQALLIMVLRNPKLIFLSVVLFSAAMLFYLLSTRRQK